MDTVQAPLQPAITRGTMGRATSLALFYNRWKQARLHQQGTESLHAWKKAFALVFCIAAFSVHSSALQAEDSREPSRFTYARLYCGADGETHFQDVTAELREMNFAPPAPPIHIGSDLSTSRAFFGGFEAGWGAHDLQTRLNHPTPAVQFGIVLQGVFSIISTAGETRRLQPGAVFRLEDAAPCKGHITVVGDQPGFLMFVR
jgi:hypothetical protein